MGMAKYDRLLFILNLLRSRKNLTAAILARECGVTERSIYRDLIALSEANVPIYFDRGYKLASDNFLPPLNFDLREYQCLKTALESSPLAEVGQYRQLLRQIRAKVDASLSAAVTSGEDPGPTTRIDIDTTFRADSVARYFADIENAIADKCCLRIEYESVESGRVERTIEPVFIVFRGRAFYLVAYCRLRQEYRTFRLDRIRRLHSTGEHFEQECPPDPEHYFDDSWELFVGDPIEVTIRFTGSAARVVRLSRHHEKEEIIEEDDGAVRYRVTVRGAREICRWILGFGAEAEVLSPVEVRQFLYEEVLRMASKYKNPSGLTV